jgi:hypothetical protein
MPAFALQNVIGKSTLRALVCCALGCLVVVASTPARAGDDGDDAPDTKFFRGLLEGIGLEREGSGNDINYHERSPLVIPPARTLPPPEKASNEANPNWPIDPEVKREKAIKAARRNQKAPSIQAEDDARPLRPDQLDGPRYESARNRDAMREQDSARPFKPSTLGYKGGLFDNMFGKQDDKDNGRFIGEPPRASLTDPPVGYQTPSPNQPYGLGKEVERPKAFDYPTQHGTQDND